MGLVLFCLLFMLGVTGMDRRRGLFFSAVSGAVLFAWTVAVIIEQARSLGAVYVMVEVIVLLIGAFLLPTACYFAGRAARRIFSQSGSDRTN